MTYNMIAAFDINRGIGKDNKIPWNIPEDLKRFSKLTKGNGNGNNAIVMGRNTWDSLPKKPLLKRDNLILSTTLKLEENTPKNNLIKSFDNILNLHKFCEEQKYDAVWVIGGSKIYEQYINDDKINKLYITFVLQEYECDTYFPNISGWKLVDNELINYQDKLSVYYQIYEKREYPDSDFTPSTPINE